MVTTKKITVAIQGGYGSFHHEATRRIFKDGDTGLLCCETFPEVFAAVENGRADYAMVAVENSIAGIIATNYSLIAGSQTAITGEVRIPVHHNLLALPGVALKNITEIHSHPMAILQCLSFLKPLLGNGVKLIETTDTALSAKNIKDKGLKNAAAIASIEAAGLYELNTLATNIESHYSNSTRFLCIVHHENAKKTELSPGILHRYTATLLFSLKGASGNIVQALGLFTSGSIGLLHIIQVPVTDKPGSYQFFADFHFSNYEIFENCIKAAAMHCHHIKTIGVYEHGIS